MSEEKFVVKNRGFLFHKWSVYKWLFKCCVYYSKSFKCYYEDKEYIKIKPERAKNH